MSLDDAIKILNIKKICLKNKGRFNKLEEAVTFDSSENNHCHYHSREVYPEPLVLYKEKEEKEDEREIREGKMARQEMETLKIM